MTAQRGEMLLYKGEEVRMATEPLKQYLINRGGIHFHSNATNCWRGYFGKWEIANNKLYLIDFEAYIDDGEVVNLSYLFPGQRKVFANWYAGQIRIPQGKILEYVHIGYESMYEEDVLLKFREGNLLEERIIDNRQAFERTASSHSEGKGRFPALE